MFQLKALLGSKLVALAGAAVLVGGGAAVAGPATTILEVVPASTEATGEEDETYDEVLEQEPAEASTTDSAAGEVLPETDPREQREAPTEVVSDQSEDGEERSEAAEAVHDALSGGLSPGHEGFGQTVAEHARNGGGNGSVASAAARDANGSARRGPDDKDVRSNETDGSDTWGTPQGHGPDGAGPPGRARDRQLR